MTDWRSAEAAYTDWAIADDTLPRMFETSAERNADRVAQQYKGDGTPRSLVSAGIVPAAPDGAFASLTYRELRDIVHNLAAGFRELGVAAGDRVAIYGSTRMEWAQSDLALLAAGAVVTTVYVESSSEQVQYLLSDPGASGVVVENETYLETVLAIEDHVDLDFVVVMDEYEGHEDRDDVLTLAEVHERGAAAFDADTYESWLAERDLDDLASIIYTSGTTGRPKGVQLTHGNFRANINQTRKRFGPRPDKGDLPTIDEGSRTLSFLPLAHVYERTVGHFTLLGMGASVAYAESTDTIGEDLALIRPTGATSVPRVYERIYAGMQERASESAAKARIFAWAMDVAREWSDAASPGPVLRAKHALADRLVYSTVREGMGGNIELLFSGGGSLSTDLARVFDGIGLTISEGYGLTETAPVVSSNPPEDNRLGTLGPPLPGVEVDLDESRVSDDQREKATGRIGELLVAGDNVFSGYWEKPDATADAFTEDGFFRTGDIVEVTDDGFLVFHERLKQILVLSTGKNVAPAPLEDAFATSDRIEQILVVGDDRKFVGALVVPNIEAVRRWATEADIDLPADDAALCAHDAVHEYIADDIERINGQFAHHETIKRFELVPEEWTPENDLLTPSMKKRRSNIEERYADQIERLYEQAARADDREAASPDADD